MGEGNPPYVTIKVGDTGIGGVIPPPMPEIPAHWGGYITVNDSDAVAEAAVAAGGVIHGSIDVPTVGRINAIGDPEGAVVSVITYVTPEEAQEGAEAASADA